MSVRLVLSAIVCLACANVANAGNACGKTNFIDTSKLESENAICTKVAEAGTATQISDAVTGDFDSTQLPGSDARNGKQMMDKFLSMMNDPGSGPTNDEIQNYAIAIAILAAAPLLFLILNLCCCFWCTCMHTCCCLCPTTCKCCKCIPKDSQYSTCEVLRPTVVMVIISVAYVIVAIVGTVNGVYGLADSSVDGICVMDNTYLRFTGFMENVKAPLDKVSVDFSNAVENMKSAVEFDPQLAQNIEDIGTKFKDVEDAAESAIQQQNTATCKEPWEELKKAAEDARKSTMASAEELKDTLEDIQTEIKSSIVDKSSDATSAIDDGSKAIDSMKNQLSTMMNPKQYGLFSFAEVQQDNRNNLAIMQFGWMFIVFVLTLASLIGMKMCSHERFMDEPPANNPTLPPQVKALTCVGKCCARVGSCSWWLVLLFGTFGALFALIFLPFTAVLSDVCTVLPDLPGKLGEITGNGQVQNISNTCWSESGNLFEGLGLDKQISVDSIDFSDFATSFENPDIDDSGLVKMEEAIAAIRQTSGSCTNINTLAGDTEDLIPPIRAQIKYSEDAFANDTSATEILESGEALVDTLKCAIDSFKNVTKCYFIKTTWDDVSDLICSGVNSSVAWLAICELLIAILAVPFAITMLIILQRHGGHGPIAHEDPDGGGVEIKEIEVNAFA